MGPFWRGQKCQKSLKSQKLCFFNIFRAAYLVTNGNATNFLWLSGTIGDTSRGTFKEFVYFSFLGIFEGVKNAKNHKHHVFFTFLGRLIWLPIAMLPTFFDFLTPLGIFLGVYFRNWSNFHFWAFSLEKVENFFQNGLNYA